MALASFGDQRSEALALAKISVRGGYRKQPLCVAELGSLASSTSDMRRRV